MIENYTNSCETYQLNKKYNLRYGLLQGKIEVCNPWNTITLDIVGPLNFTEGDKHWLLHIIDYGSRLTELFVLSKITTNVVAKLFENN
ncbi:hypothetical protein HERIO_515 [Hepatospora eriocheir]|uniref:Integrase catalytic domain-containing protein n=1 Tax=Hepatospora eriocheir TaxID=1081669 RepID=A0A1X0QD55_9MICR|nr:hypothetical protein HERIO_515 [Hepatospora eriocheir]